MKGIGNKHMHIYVAIYFVYIWNNRAQSILLKMHNKTSTVRNLNLEYNAKVIRKIFWDVLTSI